MELLLLAFMSLCASGTICFVVLVKERNQSRVAMERERRLRDCDPHHVALRVTELQLDAERERRLLGDGR